MIACNLSSPKIVDGVAKLLVKADMDKLKAPKLKDAVDVAENLLRVSFEEAEANQASLAPKLKWMVCARMFIRTALWLCNKEDKGRESKRFGSMQAIHEAFQKEIKGNTMADPMASSDSKGESLKVMTLAESNNAAVIAQQQFAWLIKDNNFLKKDCHLVHKFCEMTEEHGVFEVMDIWGQKSNVNIPHEQLSKMRPTDKNPALKVDETVVEKLQLKESQHWMDELLKAEVQSGLLASCVQESSLDLKNLLSMDDQKVYAKNQIKKGSSNCYHLATSQE